MPLYDANIPELKHESPVTSGRGQTPSRFGRKEPNLSLELPARNTQRLLLVEIRRSMRLLSNNDDSFNQSKLAPSRDLSYLFKGHDTYPSPHLYLSKIRKGERPNALGLDYEIGYLNDCIQKLCSPSLTKKNRIALAREIIAFLSVLRSSGQLVRHPVKREIALNLQSDLLLYYIKINPTPERWLRKFKNFFDSNLNDYLRNNRTGSVVYAVVSIRSSKLYIGESKRTVNERFEEHISDSRSYSARGKEWWKKSLLARAMAREGRHLFISIPIWYSKDSNAIWRKANEKRLIHAFGANLNRYHRKWYIPPANKGRRMISQRNKGKVKDSKQRFSTFHCEQKEGKFITHDLSEIYEQMNDNETRIVHMMKGKIDLTNTPAILSALLWIKKRWRSIYSGLHYLKTKGDLTIKIRKCEAMSSTKSMTDKTLLIEKLVSHPSANRPLLKKMGNQGIRELIALSNNILNGKNKSRVHAVLKKYLLRFSNVRDLPLPRLYLNSSDCLLKICLQRMTKKIIGKTKLPVTTKKYICDNTKVIVKKPITLGDMLINNSKFANNYVRDGAECTCGDEEHLSLPLNDFFTNHERKGTVLRADLVPEQQERRKDLIRSIVAFTDDLRIWRYGKSLFRIRKNKLFKKGNFLREIEDKEWFTSGKRISKQEALHLAVANLKGIGAATIIFKIKKILLSHKHKLTGNDIENTLSKRDLKSLQRKLKGFVVSRLDKGGQSLWVECPIRHIRKGVTKFIDEEKNFETLEITEDEALKRIEELYQACGLVHFRPYKSGQLPTMKMQPKWKDPQNKYRLITSYFHFPMKRLLQKCGKALRYMLKEVHLKGLMSSFTLFRLQDFRRRAKAVRHIEGRRDIRAFQSDVKCMFTNLNKNSVIDKVKILIDLYKSIHRNKPRGISVEKKAPWTCYDDIKKGLDDVEELPFDLIKRLVLWDSQSTFSRYGEQIYFQREGLPIGGICSSVYADIQCAFDEHKFLLSLQEEQRKQIVAIRQIDDLLILTTKRELKDRIISCYNEGLELEEEPVEETVSQNGNTVQKFEFIGLNCSLEKGVLKAKIANKNWKTLITKGTQEKPRFAPISCYRNGSLYRQVIGGALYRVRDYSIGGKEITKALHELKYEFDSIEYPKKLFSSVLKRFIRVKVDANKRTAWNKQI